MQFLLLGFLAEFHVLTLQLEDPLGARLERVGTIDALLDVLGIQQVSL